MSDEISTMITNAAPKVSSGIGAMTLADRNRLRRTDVITALPQIIRNRRLPANAGQGDSRQPPYAPSLRGKTRGGGIS